ncbi:hypothetical protein IG631_20912 [Alternaria alternata]|nr:hypothetical protein IG631_20912 [Alternaria alternata]
MTCPQPSHLPASRPYSVPEVPRGRRWPCMFRRAGACFEPNSALLDDCPTNASLYRPSTRLSAATRWLVAAKAITPLIPFYSYPSRRPAPACTFAEIRLCTLWVFLSSLPSLDSLSLHTSVSPPHVNTVM